MKYLIVVMSFLFGIGNVWGVEYIDPDLAYFESIDEEKQKADLKRAEEKFEACHHVAEPSTSVEGMHIFYRTLYNCYVDVVFYVIDTFQPRVADEVKQDFQTYLDAYDKMMYNQYYSLDPCGGSCGNIIEDYIVLERANMMENVARGYILAVKSYI